MKNTIKQVLQTLKDDFGISIFNDPKQFKAALTDVPITTEAKKIRNLLNIAICDMRAYSRLEAAFTNKNSLMADNLAGEMSRDYGIDRCDTQVVIACVAELLGYASTNEAGVSSPTNANTPTGATTGGTFTIAQAAGATAAGTISVSPTDITILGSESCGNKVSVTCSTGSHAWKATTSDSWITITGGHSGVGTGEVEYEVKANTGKKRTGKIEIAGKRVTITQGERKVKSVKPWKKVVSFLVVAGSIASILSCLVLFVPEGCGTDIVPVPYVIGMMQTQAESAMKNAGFTVDIHTENSDKVPRGEVIRRSPVAVSLRKGEAVIIYVSSGKVPLPPLTPPTPPPSGALTATGFGLSSNNPPTPQDWLMACRAAEADARRNLAERIKGVRVGAATTFAGTTLESDIIRTDVSAVITNAVKISENRNSDGSCQVTIQLMQN